mmetsp:Transcript_49912/g.124097  ORF Transcript_49912/g.124097 Transcript_49912/m.124097 type:complete len:411 (+) Transcript_49912:163-1395(+)
MITRSEGEVAGLGVTDLLQVGNAREVEHRRRSAQEDDRVVRRRRHVRSEHRLVDEAVRIRPASRSAVDCVPHLEARVLRAVLDDVLAEDVGRRLVGVKQPDVHLRVRLLEKGDGGLQRRRDSGAAGDEANVAKGALAALEDVVEGGVARGREDELPHRTFCLDAVADCHLLHDLSERAAVRELGVDIGEVYFDDKVDIARPVGDGRVGAHHQLARGVLGLEEDVLSDGEAEGVGRGGQREAEEARVAREVAALEERQAEPLLGVEREWRGGRGRRGGSVEGGGVELAEVELLELLPRLGGVQRLELLGAVRAANDENGRAAARVVVEEGGAVVHLVPHDEPHVVLARVLLDLRHCELLHASRRRSWRSLGERWEGRSIGRAEDFLLKPAAEVARPGERGVLELERRLSFA